MRPPTIDDGNTPCRARPSPPLHGTAISTSTGFDDWASPAGGGLQNLRHKIDPESYNGCQRSIGILPGASEVGHSLIGSWADPPARGSGENVCCSAYPLRKARSASWACIPGATANQPAIEVIQGYSNARRVLRPKRACIAIPSRAASPSVWVCCRKRL